MVVSSSNHLVHFSDLGLMASNMVSDFSSIFSATKGLCDKNASEDAIDDLVSFMSNPENLSSFERMMKKRWIKRSYSQVI